MTSQGGTDVVTTTHDPAEGGRPRLVVALGGIVMVEPDGSLKQAEFDLVRGVTRIGSSPRATVRLPGLDAEQAEVVWDQFDEYVFVQLSSSLDSRINGERMGRHPLRTGDRVEMGDWTLTFTRDEQADHGRPYGGRQGGEGAVQRVQPQRSAITPADEPRAEDLTTVPAETVPAETVPQSQLPQVERP
jgi:hypothetical protein